MIEQLVNHREQPMILLEVIPGLINPWFTDWGGTVFLGNHSFERPSITQALMCCHHWNVGLSHPQITVSSTPRINSR